MTLPRNEQDPQRLRSVLLFDNLHLEDSFEDNGVGGQQVLDLLALEDDVLQRCLSAQPSPTALQRSNRVKRAHLLRDLDATADLPPTALFSLCSCWTSPTGGGLNLKAPTLRREMSTPSRQRLTMALNCTPPGTQTRLHSSFQTLGSRPALSH